MPFFLNEWSVNLPFRNSGIKIFKIIVYDDKIICNKKFKFLALIECKLMENKAIFMKFSYFKVV